MAVGRESGGMKGERQHERRNAIANSVVQAHARLPCPHHSMDSAGASAFGQSSRPGPGSRKFPGLMLTCRMAEISSDSLPDLAVLIRRDGVILAHVGAAPSVNWCPARSG